MIFPWLLASATSTKEKHDRETQPEKTRVDSLPSWPMPHAQLASPCAAAAARRLSAGTASTSGRSSSLAAPASAALSLQQRRRRNDRSNAAAATSTTTTALCRHQPHRRGILLSGSPPLAPPLPAQRGPEPPRAVKKTFTSFDDMIKEVRREAEGGE